MLNQPKSISFYSLALSLACGLAMQCSAQTSFEDRLKSCLKGSAQFGITITNAYILYQVLGLVKDDYRDNLAFWPFVDWGKARFPKKETFVLTACIPSLMYVGKRAFKSGVRSFKKAFEKEIIQQR